MQSQFNYMNPDDLAKVIANIPTLKIRKWKDGDVAMLLKILYWCALRPGEGIRLKKDDFNLGEREVYLGQTKTIKMDKAPIPMLFVAELGSWLETKPLGPLFETEKHEPLTYDTFYTWLKRLGKLLDITAWKTPQSETGEKTVGHIFRKSIGKDMIDGTYGKKIPYEIISKQLRHKKPSITIDHYLKASIEAVKEVW